MNAYIFYKHMTHSIRQTLSVALVALFVLAVAPIFALAQSEAVDELGVPAVTVPAGTVSCFDYYTFGSVQANISAPVASAVSGTSIAFSGNLVNDNPYPIVDGALFVKVFKSRGSSNDGNGPDVVDQFVVQGDIAIPAKGSVPTSFSWRVPSYAQSGEYQIATFFTTSRKFNLLGLSFTDDVVGNTVPFRVVGEQTKGVSFNKAGVTVSGDPYFFAAFPPRASADEPVKVTAQIKNTTGKSEQASVSWTVYQWDSLLRSNAIQEEVKSVTIPAGGSAPISITITDTRYPVYLAVGTLTWQDTKSIIGVRFVREGVDRTRINFPGVTAFPLMAGQEAELFSCLHNSGGADVVPNGRLELTLLDWDNNIIHEYTYAGGVTGSMMGVADRFVPAKDYDRFRLEARLFDGEQFIDEAILDYDCSIIDPALCSSYAVEGTGLPNFMQFLSGSADITSIGMIIGAIVVLLILGMFIRRWFRSNDALVPPPSSM